MSTCSFLELTARINRLIITNIDSKPIVSSSEKNNCVFIFKTKGTFFKEQFENYIIIPINYDKSPPYVDEECKCRIYTSIQMKDDFKVHAQRERNIRTAVQKPVNFITIFHKRVMIWTFCKSHAMWQVVFIRLTTREPCAALPLQS